MDENLKAMLENLPEGKNLAINMGLAEGESLYASPTGDKDGGHEIYKILSSEGVMFTYLLKGDTLIFQSKQKPHS